MAKPVLAVLGDFSDDHAVLERAAAEFGWAVAAAEIHEELAHLCEQAHVVGVLHNSSDRQPRALLQPVWSQGTPVRSILCWRPAEHLDGQDLTRFGAYDALLRPLSFREVRRSLGFLAQAVGRDARMLSFRQPATWPRPKRAPASLAMGVPA